MKKILLVLAVAVLLVGLMVVPALAGDPFEGNPPGSQWAGHDFNGKMYFLGFVENEDDPYYEWLECWVAADDARVTGTLYLYWDVFYEIEGHVHAYGRFELLNDGGRWTGEFESIHSRPFESEKPYQNLTFASATGVDGYDGLTLTLTKHTAWGQSPIIIKGSIE